MAASHIDWLAITHITYLPIYAMMKIHWLAMIIPMAANQIKLLYNKETVNRTV